MDIWAELVTVNPARKVWVLACVGSPIASGVGASRQRDPNLLTDDPDSYKEQRGRAHSANRYRDFGATLSMKNARGSSGRLRASRAGETGLPPSGSAARTKARPPAEVESLRNSPS